MSLFTNIQEKIHTFQRKKKAKQSESRAFLNLNKVKKITIIFCVNDRTKAESIEKIVLGLEKRLKQKAKSVSLLGYYDFPKMNEVKDFLTFGKEDVTLTFFPKKEEIKRILEEEIDLLINLQTEKCIVLESISSLAKAKFRIGQYMESSVDVLDFLIQNPSQDLNYLTKEIERYLPIINK